MTAAENIDKGLAMCPTSLLTCDGEFVRLTGDVEVDSAAALRVVAAAEARHRLRALLVHVHVAGWGRTVSQAVDTQGFGLL